MLAPFLVQPELPTGPFRPKIMHLHRQGGSDAGKGISEGGDQRPVTQIPHRLGRNAVEQRSPLFLVEHGRLAGLHHMLRSAHGRCWVHRYYLAGDHPIKQHAHRGKLLLHVRRRMGLSASLYICSDIEWPDRHQPQAALLAPGEERVARACIRPPCVRVADVGCEKVDIAPSGLFARVGDQCWDHATTRQLGEPAGSS